MSRPNDHRQLRYYQPKSNCLERKYIQEGRDRARRTLRFGLPTDLRDFLFFTQGNFQTADFFTVTFSSHLFFVNTHRFFYRLFPQGSVKFPLAHTLILIDPWAILQTPLFPPSIQVENSLTYFILH